MARSFETGTLISRLGFDDPDRKDSKHDAACHYLADPKNTAAVMAAAGMEREGTFSTRDERSFNWVKHRSVFHELRRAVFEVPINKGDGQYKTTIGFCDLVLEFCFKAEIPSSEEYFLPVEVKIGRVNIGDILRQISLYREYKGFSQPIQFSTGDTSAHRWLLATAFEINPTERLALRKANVFHARLWEKFEEFAREFSASPQSDSPVL